MLEWLQNVVCRMVEMVCMNRMFGKLDKRQKGYFQNVERNASISVHINQILDYR
jgi:hypothetical protein